MINYWESLHWIMELRREVSTLRNHNRQLRERLQKVRWHLHKRNKQIKEIHRVSLSETVRDAL